jgi:predicted membrane chloride channel (bestrophin family)
LVGFLIVFRTSQAYARFWDAVFDTHQMLAQWFDAASSVVAFCRPSRADPKEVTVYLHVTIRLFSLLSSMALADLSDEEDIHTQGYDALDIQGMDKQTIIALDDSCCKVELVYQWIAQSIVDGVSTGVIAVPPPITTRAFQQLANGMVSFHDAMKVTVIPFPFPYAQTSVALLIIHWLLCPVVMVAWTSSPTITAIFTFIPVFTLWSMNLIAAEIEQPFSGQANDIDPCELQLRMNTRLLLLLDPLTKASPSLSPTRLSDPETLLQHLQCERGNAHTLALEARSVQKWHHKIHPRHDEAASGDDLSRRPSANWSFLKVDQTDKHDDVAPHIVLGNSSFASLKGDKAKSVGGDKALENHGIVPSLEVGRTASRLLHSASKLLHSPTPAHDGSQSVSSSSSVREGVRCTDELATSSVQGGHAPSSPRTGGNAQNLVLEDAGSDEVDVKTASPSYQGRDREAPFSVEPQGSLPGATMC